MTNVTWRSIAEMIGISAIVASLIFVGLQLKQSQEIALASQYQARADAAMNFFNTHLEAGFVLPMFRDKVTDTVSAEDIAATMWYWTAIDNHYYQYQNGFLAESAWQGQLRAMKQFHNLCKYRFIYDLRKHSYRPELVALVDSWEDKC